MVCPRRFVPAALLGAAGLSAIPSASAFLGPPQLKIHNHQQCHGTRPSALLMANDEPFERTVDLPGEGLSAQMKFKPVLDVPSEIVEVRYKVPFGLDVAPKNNFAVCTKDGSGGEKAGDVLRYTSQWTLGLPRGDGVITTAMSFSGGISWQCSMFDVMRAGRWEDVVEALTSNVEGRADEVILLFERPLPEEKE
ncbi:hypothetical protein ACHAWF_014492 [Thalassiosira exigua]